MVILDNHVSRADWCCNDTDGNGLWYNADYPEKQWIADWQPSPPLSPPALGGGRGPAQRAALRRRVGRRGPQARLA